MSEMMAKNLLNEAELEEVTGGEDLLAVKGQKGVYKVIAPDGVNVREKANSNSKRLGGYLCGTILKNCKSPKKGTDGYTWVLVPKQKGQPKGYVAIDYCKKQ